MLVRQTSQAASLIVDDDGDGDGKGGDGKEETLRAVEKEGRRAMSCGGAIMHAAVCCVCVYNYV